MPDRRIPSMDLQGRRLADAFARAEAPSTGSRRTIWRVAIAGGVAVVAISVALAVGLKDSARGPERLLTIDQAVAAVAKAAFDQPAYPRDKYLYISTRTESLAGAGGFGSKGHRHRGLHYLTKFDQETWTKLGAPEARRTTQWPAEYLTPADKEANDEIMRAVRKSSGKATPDYNATKHVCARTGRTVATTKRSAVANDLGPLAPPADKLPTDARQTYRYLEHFRQSKQSRQGHNADDFVWIMAHSLMQAGGPELKPAQRAALVGALAYIPGVKVLPGTVDPYGVPAIGFARDWIDRHEEAWFDSRTSMLSSMRQTQPKSKREMGSVIPAGSTIWAYRLIDYRFVDAPPKFKQARGNGPIDVFFCR